MLKFYVNKMDDATASFWSGVSAASVWVIVLIVILYAIHVARIRKDPVV
jgi:hypothetical protein